MKITTFNVNSVRTRLPILIKWLNECEPDLLFMQETKTQDEFFPDLAFSELGYKSFFHGEKSYNGVALLAKNNLDVKISFGFNDSDSESGANNFDTRILTLTYKNLFILNSYVPQGKSIDHPDFNVKKNFFARAARPGKFLILPKRAIYVGFLPYTVRKNVFFDQNIFKPCVRFLKID